MRNWKMNSKTSALTPKTSPNNQLPAWNLSDLYQGIDDSRISQDLQKYRQECEGFSKKYKGRLAGLDAGAFAEALQKYEEIEVIGSVLGEYAYLNMSTQMKNPEAMAFYQNTSEQLTEFSKPMVFFSLEINKLPENKLEQWLKAKEVAFYRPWLERVRRFKKHELSEPVEEILLEKSVTSSSAWVRLYEETSSRLVYTVDGKTYNDAEVSHLLENKDAGLRARAGKEINRISKDNAPLFAFAYNMIMKDKAIEDAKRGFKNPVSERNLSENVSDEIVETLAQTVRNNYKKLSHRFYKLKSKWLGVDKIQYWDRNAPLPFSSDTHCTWPEAVKIVLDAYKEFSPKLYDVAKDFFDHEWIDVPPRDGKRSGAFAAGTTSKHHPYLFLNFTGSNRDILTLAHELGHGCHMQLRKKNGDLNEYSRMTTEEVASVFGEMITFQSMLNRSTDDKEKLCLIAMKVNDMINTAIRQIAFHFFETRAHEERKKGELSEERLCQIWLEEMRESLGPWVNVDEDSAYIWAQIGHFYFLPFYVYAYSFADCLVNSLYQVSTEGKVKDFPDKYLNMLSQTAITEYDALLAPFELSARSAEFWNKGLSLISHYLDELEKLDKKLGL